MSRSIQTVSLFCGAGGETLGKTLAFEELGIPVEHYGACAVNHWELAVLTHGRNFPHIRVVQEDVTTVTAADFALERIDLLWASPSCVHHSRARGGKPRDDQERSHADEVVDRWLRVADVGLLLVENVPEFETWGPIDDAGQPIPERRGEYFRRFVGRLRSLGYTVDWRVLCAADYGDPTTRRRLFLQAAKDGVIAWPEPTHRDPRKAVGLFDRDLPLWRTAAECIDWSIPCPSIFDRKRPLAEATLRRIAHGVMRHVVEAPRPFVVPSCGVAPALIQTGYGERRGQRPRALDLTDPLGTVVAGGTKHALVAAFLARHNTGLVGQDFVQPMPTITSRECHAVVAASMITMRGTADDQLRATGQSIEEPLSTVSAGGIHHALVGAFLTQYYGNATSSSPDDPLPTVTTKDRHALVTVEIDGQTYAIVDIGMRMLEPRELARAMGFPDWYQFETSAGRPVSKRDAVKMIGNACPVATTKAIIKAAVCGRRRTFGLEAA